MQDRKPDFTNSAWYRDKSVMVVGLGKSGVAAVRLLQALGAKVRVADQQPEARLDAQLARVDRRRIELFAGPRYLEGFTDVDLLVVSPGVPADRGIIGQLHEQGVPLIGELELGANFLSGDLVAVTGTKGKSTTVSLLGRMLEESRRRAFVGGNLGTPLCDAVLAEWEPESRARAAVPYDVIVAEVSSFQLETIERFHPRIAVWLNFSADHLDRYRSMDEYKRAKMRIFENQRETDCAVLNADDPVVAGMASAACPFWFSLQRSVDNGAFLEGDRLTARLNGRQWDLGTKQEIALLGAHNVANVLAAIVVGLLCDCPPDAIRSAIRTFRGVPHALEVVRERRGVTFVNDSKGTNVDAALKAIESFDAPLLIILGGKDKGGDFRVLREPLRRRAKRIILIGEAAARLEEELAGIAETARADSLQDAVAFAERNAKTGDVVLLSPACASFDMFRDYQDRGGQFREIVNALQ